MYVVEFGQSPRSPFVGATDQLPESKSESARECSAEWSWVVGTTRSGLCGLRRCIPPSRKRAQVRHTISQLREAYTDSTTRTRQQRVGDSCRAQRLSLARPQLLLPLSTVSCQHHLILHISSTTRHSSYSSPLHLHGVGSALPVLLHT